MQKYLLLLCTLFLLYSCNTLQQMTNSEIKHIESANALTPFSVLLTTNEQDMKILRRPCKDINFGKDRENVEKLISRMKATMFAESGVGIAAPQIGISRNIFLFVRVDQSNAPVEVAINPKIVNRADETICFERDGCLSIPDISANSIRYPWVEVEYLNEIGEKVREKLVGYSRQDNFVAVIFQHEFDHLQGVLFTDKLCE